MKCVAAITLIFPAAFFAAARKLDSLTAGHPIESTIDLLKELEANVKEEGQTEELTYVKFEYWCKNSIKSLDSSITAGETKADTLESTVSSKTEHEAKLTADLEDLTAEIAKYAAAGKNADDSRAKTAALYTTSDTDLASTISALEDAIAALEKEPALAQVQARVNKLMVFPLLLERLGNAGMNTLFAANASSRPDMLSKGDAKAHEAKIDGNRRDSVTELLKELKGKFEDDRVGNTKDETNSVNAHSLAKNARDSASQAAADSQEEKTTVLGETKSALAEAKGSLLDVQETLKADGVNLADTKTSCNMKKSEWAERSEIRANEIVAMQEAIKILAKVAGVSTEAPSNPVLPPSPLAAEEAGPADSAALLQAIGGDNPKMMKAVNLLREEARAAHSRSLERFAEEVKAHLTGPFDDVNNMIQKMMFRLMSEQKDEDNHKNWCDLEMTKTNTSKIDKNAKIDALTLKIEAGKASAEELKTEIVTATEMVATLTKHMAEAAEIRSDGKQENKVAVKDAKSAQAAITKAVAVLESHYKKSGMMEKESYEFLEGTAVQPTPVELPAEPTTWSASYTGVSDPNKQPGGIVTVLKTISADFAQMEADTLAQEEVDQKAYDEEVKSCEIEKSRRTKEAEMKNQEKARLLDKVGSQEKSLKHVSDELATVEQYLKDLGPACIDGDSTYDERKSARAAELAALKEAQVILADAFKESEGPEAAPTEAAFLASAPHAVLIQQLRR